MNFNPIKASKEITKKYNRYLKTIFEIQDKDYNDQLLRKLDHEEIYSNGPFLEINNSFAKGKTVNELIKEGIMPQQFKKINFPLDRKLHEHQEIALRKVLSKKNIVVSTGTGSGKTESFLIPILTDLITEYETGILTPGVRALIIYPMNALANDQIKRLRSLLKDFPEITFGSYTGQTKDQQEQAIRQYRSLNGNMDPLQNEIISREKMKVNPPHILITNYAMLEYLMVRPGDSIFFDEKLSDKWKYIVLDEAHVYGGSTGIEVSMLLRRLKARINNKNIKYILTSATLGTGEDNNDVAEFASELCSSNFSPDNIIRASKMLPHFASDAKMLPIELYNNIASYIDKNTKQDEIINYIRKELPEIDSTNFNEVIYDMLKKDLNYKKIRSFLDEPKDVANIEKHMGWNSEDLNNFVIVASKAEKNFERPFDARYHMFLRATESVFITLYPNKKLFIDRKKIHFEGNKQYKVFEMATCTVCGAIYIVGKVENGILEQYERSLDDEVNEYYLLNGNVSNDDESTKAEDLGIDTPEEYLLCPQCGFIKRKGSNTHCEHSEVNYQSVYKVKTTITVQNTNAKLTKCLSCENTNSRGILRMFFTGQEAVTSVLGTSLYEELPSYETILEQIQATGFGTEQKNEIKRKNIAKQFLAFSDSRQASAYFASYFGQTYDEILSKRIFIELMSKHERNEKVSYKNFYNEYKTFLNKLSKIKELTDGDIIVDILKELVNNDGKNSLERLGLLKISNTLDFDLISGYNRYGVSFTKDEVYDLLNIFIKQMISDSAIDTNHLLDKEHEDRYSNNGAIYSFSRENSNIKGYVKSFVPSQENKINRRSDFIKRLLESKGYKLSDKDVFVILGEFFDYMRNDLGILKSDTLTGNYKVVLDKIAFEVPIHVYECSSCKKIYTESVNSKCPSFKCNGKLIEINPEQKFKNNHYYNTFKELDINQLIVKEHTAQLNKETAYQYQQDFVDKKINVLSCSTTFEMGVDVGDLETVMLRNVPPTPANYAQRVGRAGRSSKACAYALTFCNKSSHDFSYFRSPLQMIKGRINTPKFNKENEKIAIRHIYASALGMFWQNNQKYFEHNQEMFENKDGTTGYDKFCQYLKSKPEELKKYLKEFLSDTKLGERLGVDSFKWVESLIGDKGTFDRAVRDYNSDVKELNEAVGRPQNRPYEVAALLQRIANYRNEDILSFLSRKNVIPKYGFPVDTVELGINNVNNSVKAGIELQRDLSIALSEYAPGSQVVANDKLLTSRYVKRPQDEMWKIYRYVKCPVCQSINIELFTTDSDETNIKKCNFCETDLISEKFSKFLVPEFGFEVDTSEIKKPGLIKPEKTYSNRATFIGGKKREPEIITKNLDNARVEIVSYKNDEMSIINENNFYICDSCGYSSKKEAYLPFINENHRKSNGYSCASNRLNKYSLGYIFETDVVKVQFNNPEILYDSIAYSVLYSILEGMSKFLSIERKDIDGCIQWFKNLSTGNSNYSLIIYDKTPGGAGHVKRILDSNNFEKILAEALIMLESCNCGSEEMETSCYGCLRNYQNQRHHDILNRGIAIKFIKSLTDKNIIFHSLNGLNKLLYHEDKSTSIKHIKSWDELIINYFDDSNKNIFQDTDLSNVKIPDYISGTFSFGNNTIIVLFVYLNEKIIVYDKFNDAEEIRKLSENGWKCIELSDMGNVEELSSDVINV